MMPACLFPPASATTICMIFRFPSSRKLAGLGLAPCLFLFFSVSLQAAEPTPRTPPEGIQLSENQIEPLQQGLFALQTQIQSLQVSLQDQPQLHALLPDVQIFARAVREAIELGMFYEEEQLVIASELLAAGSKRASQLENGIAPWIQETGLVVRGYRSKLDDTVQPYGLVIPESYSRQTPAGYWLDVWLHGRDNRLSELKFIHQRRHSPGPFTPPNALVLHPYGRYCNAFKFAGEVDVLEAMDHVRSQYAIDPTKLAVRGFSMGGAGCWHLATHHADLWKAAAPGAGFAETPEYLGLDPSSNRIPSYEKTLWHWYNATDYSLNLFQCATVAYSGEKDKQKQAADVMARSLRQYGIDLTHVIGPDTGHKYHPQAKTEIDRRINAIMETPTATPSRELHFTTWTLRYPSMEWITLQGLQRHWNRATIHASMPSDHQIQLTATNITALTLHLPPGSNLLHPMKSIELTINGQSMEAPKPGSDRSWECHLARSPSGSWSVVQSPPMGGRKGPGLQGPIDDAFMDPFLFIEPTGAHWHPEVARWTREQMETAQSQWRLQFRGDVRIKSDTEVTQDDLEKYHLILWGDPSSNQVLKQIANRLPIRWTQQGVQTPDANYPAPDYLPQLIYPNPLQPNRYVVINSGFTFSKLGHQSNAQQTPKLPDFAIVNIRNAGESYQPAEVVKAGFFREDWSFPAQ